MPGVVAVLTLDDLAPVLRQRRMVRISNSGTKLDQSWPFALADGEVSFVGEPVAIVVASDRYVAEDAAALVAVDYDVLPAAIDCRVERAPPVRRELTTNQVISYKVAYGDSEAAFAKAAHVVHEDLWVHRGAAHSMEGRGILVQISDRETQVWASTQKAHDLSNALADYIDLDESRLRVATPDVGGGFGPKLCVYPEDVAMVAAATLLRRSVKWIEDRREHFTNAAQERDQYWSIEIAADADGRVRGIRGRLIHDIGAYALQDVNIPYNSATTLSGPYMVPALAMDVVATHTNKAPVSSVRGAGYPQAAFAMERLMDSLARAIGIERAELRRRNLIPAEKMPYLKPLKARSGEQVQYDSGDYPGCQADILRATAWDDFPRRQAAARASKAATSASGWRTASRAPAAARSNSAACKFRRPDASRFRPAPRRWGKASPRRWRKSAPRRSACARDDVTVVSGDTSAAPLGLGGFASRQTVTAGSSVQIASQAVAAKARKLASHMLEAAEEDLEIVDGEVRVVGAPQLAVKLGELARVLKGAPGYAFPKDIDPGLAAKRHSASISSPIPMPATSSRSRSISRPAASPSCAMSRSRIPAAASIRMIVEGQVHGGIAHGIGNAMFEWMGYDDAGQPVTTTFADYLLPTATEVPIFETLYKESPSPHNPLGVKGVGEVGVIPAAAAIISAIEDALSPFNVRIAQMPITPPKLVELIAQGARPIRLLTCRCSRRKVAVRRWRTE